MIKSMTGFGRAETVDLKRRISVEMKSVNHRYLDLNIKIPKKMAMFESAVRSVIKEYLSRGKVDVFITYEDYQPDRVTLKYNQELAAEYLNYFKRMETELGIENDIRVSGLARFPEVFSMEEQSADEDEIWEALVPVLRSALEKMVLTREAEGQHLKEDLIGKLDGLEEKVCLVEERSPRVVAEYRAKLEAKVKELLETSTIDENRIAAEVVIYSDKICNDEETVRLHSHIKGMKQALEKGKDVGRRLDFIAQEMNREANTILSKSNDITVSDIAIDLKTEIEKIREQIQNLE